MRELQNIIERAVITSRLGDLRFDLPEGEAFGVGKRPANGQPIITYAELKRREKENVVVALEQTQWKVSGPAGAAELLGVSPTTLASRMKAMGIRKAP